jgi:hypothetical protein
VQGGGADDLDIEVPLAEDPLRRLPDRGECLDLKVIEGLACTGPVAEFDCLGS